MTKLLLILAALGTVPREDAIPMRAAEVEINHTYDETGELIFIQIILWDQLANGQKVVAAYHVLSGPANKRHFLPVFTKVGGLWRGIVRVKSRIYVVQTERVYETYKQSSQFWEGPGPPYDSERENLKIWPKHKRIDWYDRRREIKIAN